MSESTGRPQDQGRRHRRVGAPEPETVALLGRYQVAMRTELEAILSDLQGVPQPDGLHGPVPPKRPSLADRDKLWGLAIRLARELGQAVDPGPPPDPGGDRLAAARSARPRGRVDYG